MLKVLLKTPVSELGFTLQEEVLTRFSLRFVPTALNHHQNVEKQDRNHHYLDPHRAAACPIVSSGGVVSREQEVEFHLVCAPEGPLKKTGSKHGKFDLPRTLPAEPVLLP